ncbi:MAG: hypothetical protein WCI05_06255, partial [Myxococcales bacterium]
GVRSAARNLRFSRWVWFSVGFPRCSQGAFDAKLAPRGATSTLHRCEAKELFHAALREVLTASFRRLDLQL